VGAVDAKPAPARYGSATRRLRSFKAAMDRIRWMADRWLEASRRAAADADALSAMSERELRDIGIERVRVSVAAESEWMRDRFL